MMRGRIGRGSTGGCRRVRIRGFSSPVVDEEGSSYAADEAEALRSLGADDDASITEDAIEAAYRS
jgi:hypothetical protein